MLQTQQPVLRKFYYPVMPVANLQDGPKPFTLFGEPIVVWLDEQGHPAAAVDRCCHRTAKLSKGWLSNGCIVCPYHGWQFNREGKCTYFPQSELEDPADVRIVENEQGFDTYAEIPVTNKLNSKMQVIDVDEKETVRITHSRWFLPFIRQTDITYPTGLVHSIVTCATPIDDESCMLTQFVYRNDTEEQVPAENVIAFDRAVVIEDMDVLETTEPNVPLDIRMRLETHMHADKPGILMREMLLKLFDKHGEKEVLPQLSTPQLYKMDILERRT
jgi:phenylpropionate dioxygenase-like ring-hydroxylating dioxygenase large terminal subunit